MLVIVINKLVVCNILFAVLYIVQATHQQDSSLTIWYNCGHSLLSDSASSPWSLTVRIITAALTTTWNISYDMESVQCLVSDNSSVQLYIAVCLCACLSVCVVWWYAMNRNLWCFECLLQANKLMICKYSKFACIIIIIIIDEFHRDASLTKTSGPLYVRAVEILMEPYWYLLPIQS